MESILESEIYLEEKLPSWSRVNSFTHAQNCMKDFIYKINFLNWKYIDLKL